MRKSAGFAVITLFAINILNFYDRNVAGAVVEPMRKEFHLTDLQIGFLTTAMTVLYAIIGVPLGRIADVWSRKRLLALGVVVWSALTGFTYFAVNYAMVLFARLGVGVGEAACAPTATSWLGDLMPPTRRARALGLFMLGVPVGGALSYFFSGPIAHAYGWRIAMVVAAAPALLLIPALLILREPSRGESEGRRDVATGSMWIVLRIPTLWWIIASGALVNFNMYAIGTFMPAMFGRIFRLDVGRAGIITGVVYMAGGLAGGMFGGFIGDWIMVRYRNGRLWMGAVLSLAGAPFAFLGAAAGDLNSAILFWTIAYASLNTYYGLVYSSIQDIVAPAQRGATMALYFMAMYLCGASFGSLITGGLSDHYARIAAQAAGSRVLTEAARAAGLQQAMLVIAAVNVGLAFVLYMGSRTILKDMARRDAASAATAAVA